MIYRCPNCKTTSIIFNRGRCPKCQRPHIESSVEETRSYTNSSVSDTSNSTDLTDMVVLAAVIKSDESYLGSGGLFGGAGASSSWSDSSSSDSSSYSSSSSDYSSSDSSSSDSGSSSSSD